MLNFLFSNFQNYRAWRGGIWWLVVEPEGEKHWVNKCPNLTFTIRAREDYTKGQYCPLTDQEFYQAIANIPRNGEWHDDLNLTKYLRSAKLLRGAGIEDAIAIKTLTDLYKASSMEQTTSLHSRQYFIEEIMEIVNRD